MNIGSIVRSANAFGAAEVHIIGKRRWNRRGAMVTDRYQHVRHHEDVAAFTAWAVQAGIPIIAVDNVDGSVPVDRADLATASYTHVPLPVFLANRDAFLANPHPLGLLVSPDDSIEDVEADLERGTLTNVTRNIQESFPPFPPFLQTVIASGGLLNSLEGGKL